METKAKYYQEFQGKKYWLQKSEKYLMSHNKRLHRVVWEHHNGTIPKGMHVHHVDGDCLNNCIDNLNLINGKLHARFEAKKRITKNPDTFKKFQEAGIERAKEWHKSEEGIEWHKKKAKEQGFGKWDLPKMICPGCDEEFKPKVHHQKVCSNRCKARERRKRLKLDIKI